MRTFISRNFFNLVVIALILVLLIQRCGSDGKSVDIKPAIKIDTIWVVKDSIVLAQPQLLFGKRDTIYENTIEYLPSADYDALRTQFQALKEDLLSRNTYVDTLRIDTTGFIYVKDEIQKNQILKRQYEYKLKYPEVTRTVNNYVKDGRQLYLGGGMAGNKDNIINSAQLGFLYKDKKDRIFGVGVNKMFAPNTPLTYGVSTYWKLKATYDNN